MNHASFVGYREVTTFSGVPMEVSKFWDQLGDEHRHELDRYGYNNVKRRQAFRYFNWNWRWRSLPKSEQWKFLYRNTSPSTFLRCLMTPPVLNNSDWKGLPLSRADRTLYTMAVRMLWEYATANDYIGVLKLDEPTIGNPVPVRWNGRLISQDLANSSLEINALSRSLGSTKPRKIIEIGAGYGRTAYVLLSLFREASYTIIDIEPALSISRWYLSKLFPERDLRFISAQDAIVELSHVDEPYDLSLSISSLQEMTLSQITEYLALIDRVTSNGLVYLKQWRHWYNDKDNLHVRFSEYPIPARWGLCFTERAPVQTNFDHSCWRIL